jgi:Zn-finger nucleic acid-binding protein
MSGHLQDGVKTCGTIGCPDYGQTMSKSRDRSNPQIEIDTCHGCGTVALDPGELEALVGFAISGTRARLGGHAMPAYQPVSHGHHSGGFRRRSRSSFSLFDWS